ALQPQGLPFVVRAAREGADQDGRVGARDVYVQHASDQASLLSRVRDGAVRVRRAAAGDAYGGGERAMSRRGRDRRVEGRGGGWAVVLARFGVAVCARAGKTC